MGRPRALSGWRAAGLTIVCVAVAIALAWGSQRPFGRVSYAAPLACVAVLAFVGGRVAGLVATLGIAIGVHAHGVTPWTVRLEDPDALRTVVFLLVGAVVSGIAGARHRSRAQLAAERNAVHRYELLAQHSRDIVLLMGRDGRILEANAAAEAAYGRTREELLALTIFDLRADGGRDVAAAGQMAAADERGILFETAHRRRDGTVFPVEVSSQGATIDGTRTLVSVIRDITERRRAEEALRQSEQRLRGMFENAPLGVVEVDADDRFVAANDRVCAILGRSRDELLGMTIRELTAAEDRGRSDEVNARLRSGPQDVIEYEKRYLRKDGTPVWAHVTISAVRDSSGRYAGGIGVVEEIGARKAAEADRERLVEALRDADRKKDEFLGILSHELRNPLAPIRNSVYILKHAEPGAPQALRAREVIDRQTNHMTRLVDDLLDVTRIARGKIELRRGEVNLADVVRRTGEDHRSLMTDREIELTVEVPEDPIWVRGDPTRLEQVVGNLLQNAAKFSQRRGRVALVLRADPGQAWISVRDTGVGIDRALLDKVFDPFVQAERTLARSSGGLGLGLALVKGLTELHGGTVSVSSDGPGRGSEFRIVLPLLTPAESLGEPPGPARRDGRVRQRRCRVLVVDDNVDAAESLAELVEVFGHDADVAHDGPTAVATARVTHPDVILCDIGLPGMDGYEVARTLRADAALSGTHLVAVTGYAHPDDLERASRAGFDCHVAKPPSPEEIDRLLQ